MRQGWALVARWVGMDLAVAPLTDLTTWLRSSGLEIVLIVTGALLVTRAARWFGDRVIRRIEARPAAESDLVRSEAAKHGHVVTQVTMWAVIVLTYSVAGVLVLQRLGVPITGLVAPAAVVGVAVGFGAQRLVQDLLAGIFIIAERQYGFGDVIRIAVVGGESGADGTVEEVTLRSTRLRTVNGEVIIVGNGQIAQVTNMSRDWARVVVDVPVPTGADIPRVRDVLQHAAVAVRDDERLGPLLLDTPSVVGVESIEVDTLHVRIVARTLPGKQFDVGRELRSRVAVALRAEGIITPTRLDTAEPTEAS
jgi:moderate conductance mechanosensitive channel